MRMLLHHLWIVVLGEACQGERHVPGPPKQCQSQATVLMLAHVPDAAMQQHACFFTCAREGQDQIWQSCMTAKRMGLTNELLTWQDQEQRCGCA